MIIEQACVLVSGGLDSVAALFWASATYKRVRAMAFDYGQPNRDAELYSAGSACEGLGITWDRVVLADAFPRAGLLASVPEHEDGRGGVNLAFVPGRNGAFLWLAASHASTWWTGGNIAVVIGANKQDAEGFPDCRPNFLLKIGAAIRDGLGRQVDVVAPWIDRTKSQILRDAPPEAMPAIARSWSCYARTGPCRVCTACVLRARAFAEAGLAD